MRKNTRLALWYVLEALIVTGLVLLDRHITWSHNLLRVQPPLLMGIFFLLQVFVLLVRTGVDRPYPWWQVWRVYDIFTIVMASAAFTIGIYEIAVAAGFGSFFDVPLWVYTAIRVSSLVVGFIGIGVLIELSISAIEARMRKVTISKEFYDRDGNASPKEG